MTSVDKRRKEALIDLKDRLADGVDPVVAVPEVASEWAFSPEVIATIGKGLIAQRARLIEAKANVTAKRDRQRRADKVIHLYEQVLISDPEADSNSIENSVGVEDFSPDEGSDLFLRILDAYIARQLKAP